MRHNLDNNAEGDGITHVRMSRARFTETKRSGNKHGERAFPCQNMGGFRAQLRIDGKDVGMTQRPEDYEDIPGTWVFDAQRARIGYRLNEFLYSLMKAENRKEFLADEGTYTLKFGMTDEQRDAVLHRDWNKLLELGGVSYALAKLAFTDGKSYQFMASQMTGMEEKDYVAMMLAGGRSPDGWRSKSERKGKD